MAAASHDAVLLQLGRVLLGGIVATLGWIIGAASVGALQEQRDSGLLGAGIAGFLIAVFSGVGDLSTLGRSQIPYVFPAVTARAAAAVSLGLGLGLAAAALLVVRRHPDLFAARQGG